MEGKIGEILIDSRQIQSKVAELGRRIETDYKDATCLLVGILKGAFIFMGDLARNIHSPAEFDFMAVSSYGTRTKTSGVVRIIKDLDIDITGQHVLIVEDIIDTGLTLKYLMANLEARGPASLEVCALLNKMVPQGVEIPVKYEGFRIEDVFVVGYGLDYDEKYRNLPYIAKLEIDA